MLRSLGTALAAVVLLLAAGCDLRPGTATFFQIGGKLPINAVTLRPPASDENRKPIKLRFSDDNTFQTNDYLTAGRYRLVMRTEEGMTLDTEVDVTPEKWFYKIPEVKPSATSGGGSMIPPMVTAGITVGPGLWRVEIIAPGDPPQTATVEAVKITVSAETNLGDVVLR